MTQKPYNILLSANACSPNSGGESGNGWNWAVKLAELGHNVWCITREVSREVIEKELEKGETPPNLQFIFADVPQWVKKAYAYRPGVYLYYLYWQHSAYLKAKELSKKVKLDLVHHVTLGSLQMGSEMYKLNKPLVFGPVGGGQYAPKIFKPYFMQWWKFEVFRSVTSKALLTFNRNTRQTLRRAKLVLTSNFETRRLAEEVGARTIRMHNDTGLPMTYYPEQIPANREKNKLKIFWIGRLFARKGLLLVLQALAQVPERVDFEFTIAGDGPMGPYVNGWIEELGLKEKVNWLGRIPWEQTREAYTAHNLFMFCSLRDSFASQFMEAMAFGLPVLTLNINGARDMIPDGAGIKVDATNLTEVKRKLAEGVTYFYDQPEERERMGKVSFDYAKTFEWNTIVGQMCKCYDEIMEKEIV